MDTRSVENVLSDFLKNSHANTMVLKGDWGVGKTTIWQKTVERYTKENYPGTFKYYCYASFFGVKSIENIREQLSSSRSSLRFYPELNHVFTFFKKECKGKRSDITLSFFQENKWKDVLVKVGKLLWQGVKFSVLKIATNARNLFSIFDGIVVNLGRLYGAFSYSMVKNCIVCLDDLERKGEAVDIGEVLGLISSLKDQRDCKIILIYNEDKLDGLKLFGEYREKVVDFEITYTPSTKEAIKLIVGDSPKETYLKNAEQYLTILDCQNIRLILKIDNFLKRLSEVNGAYEDDPYLLDYITRIVVFYFWFHYNNKNETTGWSLKDIALSGGKTRKKLTDGDTDKDKILQYGYIPDDSFNVLLIEFLENGIFLDKKFDKNAELLLKKLDQIEKNNIFQSIWKLWISSLQDVGEELKELIKKASLHMEYWSVNDLHSCIFYLESCDDSNMIKSVIDKYIESNGLTPDAFLPDESFPQKEFPDNEYFLEKSAECQRIQSDNVDEMALLTDMYENGVLRKDIAALEGVHSDQIKDFLLSVNDQELTSKLSRMILLCRENDIVLSNICEALQKIGNLSSIQKVHTNVFVKEAGCQKVEKLVD